MPAILGKTVLRLRQRRKTGSRPVVFARAPHALHAMLTSAGLDDRRDPAYDWHGLRRGTAQFTLFQYTLAGQGMLEFEGRRHVITPGQALILHFPHDNRYWLEPGGRWRFFWLCLNGAEAMRAWRVAIARLGPVLALADDSPLLNVAAHVAGEVIDDRVRSPWQASAMAYELAMRLMDEALPFDPRARRQQRPEAVQRSIDFVRDHLDEAIDVGDMAAAAGFSRFHFARVFRQSEGQSPGEYLSRRRIREAVGLLETTDLPIKAIAARCGFASANYFAKAFTKAMGASPGSLRRSGMY